MAYSSEEIEKMRAAVAAHDIANAGSEAESRVEYMKSVRDFVDGDVFKTFETELAALQPTYAADNNLNVHINAILMILENLAKAANHHIPVTTFDVAVEPTEQPEPSKK